MSTANEVAKAVAFFLGVINNPNEPKQNVDLAKIHLKRLLGPPQGIVKDVSSDQPKA